MRNERGFTLVETMVSLAVLTTGLLLFLHATALSLQLYERSRRISEALLLAQEKMEALTAEGWENAVADCAGEGDLGEGEVQDTFTKETFLRGVFFRLVLERAVIDPGLEHYRVSCFWKDGAEEYGVQNSVSLLGARGRYP